MSVESMLGTLPRVRLGRTPTPLHEAVRLREALGGPARCPRILFKRDDLTDLALGGNKARKLEFLLGAALRQRATALITTGGPQSNHARMTAAAATLCGLRCVLVLSGPGPRGNAGNLILDRLLGADVLLLDPGLDEVQTATAEQGAIRDAEESIRSQGGTPYVIPLGGSDWLGTLGYVECTRELMQQFSGETATPAHLYHASGSRGTQAGLELGRRLCRAPWRITGVAVSPGEASKRARAVELMHEAAEHLGATVAFSADELITDQDHYGAGYAIPTPAAAEAIALVARTEAILLDPVYTGKAMAGMLHHIREGAHSPDETVLFLHTGGVPGLFAMPDSLMA